VTFSDMGSRVALHVWVRRCAMCWMLPRNGQIPRRSGVRPCVVGMCVVWFIWVGRCCWLDSRPKEMDGKRMLTSERSANQGEGCKSTHIEMANLAQLKRMCGNN
jgi:hypothetical protein